MSTIKTTNIQHPSAASPAIELTAAGGLWLGGGKILQVVTGTHSTQVSTTSTTFVTTNLTATITPSSASSKVLILAQNAISNNSNAYECNVTLFRGTVAGTNLGDANKGFHAVWSLGGSIYAPLSIVHLDSPSTTSAQIYTVGFKVDNAASTARSSIGGAVANIVLMEVSA